jgi:hypothetical protein
MRLHHLREPPAVELAGPKGSTNRSPSDGKVQAVRVVMQISAAARLHLAHIDHH